MVLQSVAFIRECPKEVVDWNDTFANPTEPIFGKAIVT